MNHTAKEVRANVAENRRHMTTATEAQLTAYAGLLERSPVVTDEVCREVMRRLPLAIAGVSIKTVRDALLAVWPVAAEAPEGCTPADAAMLRRANHDLAGEADSLRQALQFYADQQHLVLNEPGAWDSVSGEGQNWLCDAAGTATVENGWVARDALKATVAAEPAQEVPVAYLAENANEAFLFFADDHEGLDAYTADGFSITPLVRHPIPEASCGDCPTRDYKSAEPAQPADSGKATDAMIAAAPQPGEPDTAAQEDGRNG